MSALEWQRESLLLKLQLQVEELRESSMLMSFEFFFTVIMNIIKNIRK